MHVTTVTTTTCTSPHPTLPRGHRYMYPEKPPACMLRSYHPEKTRSHQNSEVNLDWATPVLGREITWEPVVS